ncbi:hypothetical protein ACHAWF_016572 [Thalassiosira exigua]
MKRCPVTYAKTVELLCCSWLKSVKFDHVALLDKLDPVLNENVCEAAARVILRVASALDCEGSDEGGVDLVRRRLGAPEVREMRRTVLRKMDVGDIARVRGAEDEDGEKEEGEDESVDAEAKAENEEDAEVVLSPSTALFLRVKCDLAVADGRPDLASEVVLDIPTLCAKLGDRTDELVAFHARDDYEDLDEDRVADYEDVCNFVCLQLIRTARSSPELREEGGRRHLVSVMRRALARLATPDDLVEACVGAMAAAHDKEAQFLQTVSEVLVDVEDDDTFRSRDGTRDERALVIVRQMRAIAVLSVVLESVSSRMVSHPILDGFFRHLSPAITSKNAIVREHGVA